MHGSVTRRTIQLVEWTEPPAFWRRLRWGQGWGHRDRWWGLDIFKELCGDFCFPRKDL